MAQVPYTSFYQGPFAVYTSPTGMQSNITNVPYLGGSLHSGDYCDLQANEAAIWNQNFGSKLNAGRYRLVQVSALSTAASIAFGKPVGWGAPQSVGQVAITSAGTGSGSGTVTCSSTTSGGIAATASVTVSAGVIVGVQLINPGSGFTAVPTWGLTELTAAGITSSGTIASEMAVSPNFVGSFDTTASIALSAPRGIALVAPTSAQVTAGAWIVIQESGIAPALVTTNTSGTIGNFLWAGTGGAITSNVPAWYTGMLGWTVDTVSAANQIVRVNLTLPMVQG